MKVVNTGFVKDWKMPAVVVAAGIGEADALLMMKVKLTDYIIGGFHL